MSCSILKIIGTCLFSLPLVASHGSLVIPQTRNSIDRFVAQWKGGYPVQHVLATAFAARVSHGTAHHLTMRL